MSENIDFAKFQISHLLWILKGWGYLGMHQCQLITGDWVPVALGIQCDWVPSATGYIFDYPLI